MNSLQRNQTLDVLRAAAALLIAVHHFLLHRSEQEQLLPQFNSEQPVFRFIADSVLVFFVISAIVIPQHLDHQNYRIGNLHQFLLKRFLRIYLPLLATIAATLTVEWLFRLKNGLPFVINGKQLLSNLTLSCEFTRQPWYNVVFWTLSIELQFYLFVGIVFPWIRRYGLAAIAVVFCAGEAAVLLWDDTRFLHYYTPWLTLGFLLFLWQKRSISNLQVMVFSLVIGAVILLVNVPATVWTVLLIPAVVIGVKKVPAWLSAAGKYSYSFYLIHGLVGGHLLYFTRSWGDAASIIVLRLLLAVCAAAVTAWLFYRLIELPALKWGRRITYRKN